MNAQYRTNKHNKKSLSSGIDSAFLLPAYLKRIEAVIVSVPPKSLFVLTYILTQ